NRDSFRVRNDRGDPLDEGRALSGYVAAPVASSAASDPYLGCLAREPVRLCPDHERALLVCCRTWTLVCRWAPGSREEATMVTKWSSARAGEDYGSVSCAAERLTRGLMTVRCGLTAYWPVVGSIAQVERPVRIFNRRWLPSRLKWERPFLGRLR